MNEQNTEAPPSKGGILDRDLRSWLPPGTEKCTRWAIYSGTVLCLLVLVLWFRDTPWTETSNWLPFVFLGLFALIAFYTFVVLRVDRFAGWSVFASGLAITQLEAMGRYDPSPRIALMLVSSYLLLITVALAHDVEYARRRCLEQARHDQSTPTPN